MPRKPTAGIVSLALFLTPMTPAVAQDYRFSGYDSPRGATATVNLRVPLGRRAEPARPTLGLTFGYGQTIGGPASDGRTSVRQLRVADIRFGGDGVTRAEVASFDLANLDADRRLNLGSDSKGGVWYVLLLAAGVSIAVLVALTDGSDSDTSEPDTPPPTAG